MKSFLYTACGASLIGSVYGQTRGWNNVAVPKSSYIFTADMQSNSQNSNPDRISETSTEEIFGDLVFNMVNDRVRWETQHIGITLDQQENSYNYRAKSTNNLNTVETNLNASLIDSYWTLEAWVMLPVDNPVSSWEQRTTQFVYGFGQEGSGDETDAQSLHECAVDSNIWLASMLHTNYPNFMLPSETNCEFIMFDSLLPHTISASSRIQFTRFTYYPLQSKFYIEAQPFGKCYIRPLVTTDLDLDNVLHLGLKHLYSENQAGDQDDVTGQDFTILSMNFYQGDAYDTDIPPRCNSDDADENFLNWLPNSAPACPDATVSIDEDECVPFELWYESDTCSFASFLDEWNQWVYDGASTCCPDACCDLDNFARATVADLSGLPEDPLSFYLSQITGSVSVFTDSNCLSEAALNTEYSSSTFYLKSDFDVFGDAIGSVEYYMSDGTDDGPVSTRTVNSVNTPDPPVPEDSTINGFASMCFAVSMTATDVDGTFAGGFEITSAPNPQENAGATLTSSGLYALEGCGGDSPISTFPYVLPIGESTVYYKAVASGDGSSDIVVTDTLTFRAYDEVTGDYSVTTADISVVVYNNIAGVSTTIDIPEDQATVFNLEGFDSAGGSDFIVYLLSTPHKGHLQKDSVKLIVSEDSGYTELSSKEVEYVPPLEEIGSPLTNFTFRIGDSTGAFSAPATIQLNVLPGPDAPTLRLATDVPGGNFYVTTRVNDFELISTVDLLLEDVDEPTDPEDTYRCEIENGPMYTYMRLPNGQDAYLNNELTTDGSSVFTGSFKERDVYFSGSFTTIAHILRNIEIRAGSTGPGDDTITVTCYDDYPNTASKAEFVIPVVVVAEDEAVSGTSADSFVEEEWYDVSYEVMGLYAVVALVPVCCVLCICYSCCRKFSSKRKHKLLQEDTDVDDDSVDSNDIKMTVLSKKGDTAIDFDDRM